MRSPSATRLSVMACLGLAAASASAQTLVANKLRKWDGTDEWASRAALGSAAGHVSQAFPPGIVSGLHQLSSFAYIMQDENDSTQEAWNVKICPLGRSGLPDYSAGILVKAGIKLPAGSGRIVAYRVTHTLSRPLAIPQNGETWNFTWEFTAAARFPSDGISLHLSPSTGKLPGGSGALTCVYHPPYAANVHREIPRIENRKQVFERFAHAESLQGTTRTVLPLYLSWLLDLGFVGVTLNGAAFELGYNGSSAGGGPCPNPNTGYASLDPDFANVGALTPARNDDYSWIVSAGSAYANGFAFVFVSTAVLTRPISTPFGPLFLDPTPTDPLFSLGAFPLGALDSAGRLTATIRLGPPGSQARKSISSIPSCSAQAIVVGKAFKLRFSNVFTLRPRLNPAGFSQGFVAAAAPFSLTRPARSQSFWLRNDGPGNLVVEQRAGTTRLGSTITVPERAAGRLRFVPLATGLRILSTKTRAASFVHRFDY